MQEHPKMGRPTVVLPNLNFPKTSANHCIFPLFFTLPLVYLSSLNQQWVYFALCIPYTQRERRHFMDQIKIGRFIAECRKTAGFTQMQLAEQLGLTDKAISKWETGKAMPDTAIMLPLCEILSINVNELLCGERIKMENNQQTNEQLLLNMSKELEQKNKTIWTTMWVIMGVSITALLAGIFLVAFLIPEGIWQGVAILALCIVFLIPCFYALKLEVSVGAYKCKNCGHKIVPTYTQALNAMHMGTTRYLKCPKCGQRTWCKKVLKK
jgi:transcriptional regulator with XRE-family HTH domain/DNA-directed RNA polymerase subunit RPC12/RpoP